MSAAEEAPAPSGPARRPVLDRREGAADFLLSECAVIERLARFFGRHGSTSNSAGGSDAATLGSSFLVRPVFFSRTVT